MTNHRARERRKTANICTQRRENFLYPVILKFLGEHWAIRRTCVYK